MNATAHFGVLVFSPIVALSESESAFMTAPSISYESDARLSPIAAIFSIIFSESLSFEIPSII